MEKFFVRCILLLLLKLSALMLVAIAMSTSNPCNFSQIRDGVCICNSTYCDTLDVPNADCGEYVLVTSSKSGKRFDITKSQLNTVNCSIQSDRSLKINANETFQQIIGFGGALTDATSLVIDSMDEAIREFVYKSYISDEFGANYGIIRIPLGASDFSDKVWAYHEKPEGDPLLKNMTELSPYDRRRIDQIKQMNQFMVDSNLKLMLCAWGSPPWMKNNRRWNGLSRLRPEFYSTWALYHVKALDLFKNEGINFWSLSMGNEPIIAPLTSFVSLGWRPNDLRRWVSGHLKPMLNESGYSDLQILSVDDNRSALFTLTRAFERDRRDPHLVDTDMIGIHWYLDNMADASWIDRAAKRYQIPILHTEGCEGAALNRRDMVRGPVLGSWLRCQEYVRKYIGNLNHGVAGFIDWNMVLDQQGGPNYVRNFADAPMIFHQQNQTLYKQPMFYGIAHFSKFLKPDCVRIKSELSSLSQRNIDATAFSCANSTRVIIMYNRNTLPESIAVNDKNFQQINLTLDPESVNTLIYQTCD